MTTLLSILLLVAAAAVLAVVVGRRLSYEGYWLNNRSSSQLLLIATIVATQVGAGTTLGIAASTAQSGTGYGLVAVVTTFIGFLLIPLVIPRVGQAAKASGEFTLTGLLRWKFGRATGFTSAVVVIIGYLGLIAGQFVAGAALLEALTPLSWEAAILVSAVAVVTYSAFAGLRGDFVTDGFLLAFMALLLALTLGVIWTAIGSRADLVAAVPAEIWSPVRFGGYAYLIGGFLIGSAIPVVSLEMWLRVFAATDVETARRAFRWSAFAIIPFYVAPMAVGGFAAVLTPEAVGSQTVMVSFLGGYLPGAVMIAVYVGLVATIISTSNTLQLVISAVVHRDLLPRRESVSVSRWTAVIVGIVASAGAYVTKDIVSLVLTGFYYILLIGPLFLNLVADPVETEGRRDDYRACASLIVGIIVTSVGIPFFGVAAVIAGFFAVMLGLALSRRLSNRVRSQSQR